mgnify:CR=1 FL=1
MPVVATLFSVFASVHRGFAPPAPGQVDTDAEEAVNWEAGVRYSGMGVDAAVTGFYNDFSNFIGSCTASTGGGCVIGDQFDGGEVDVMGIEASFAGDLAPALGARGVSLPWSLAYTYTDAEFETAFESDFGPWGEVAAGDELPYVPEHQLTARFGLETDRWGADALMSWVDEARASAGQGPIAADERIEDRVVVDLSGHVNVGENVRLTASVQNAFDETYAVSRAPAGLRPGLPRTAMIGLTLDY